MFLYEIDRKEWLFKIRQVCKFLYVQFFFIKWRNVNIVVYGNLIKKCNLIKEGPWSDSTEFHKRPRQFRLTEHYDDSVSS